MPKSRELCFRLQNFASGLGDEVDELNSEDLIGFIAVDPSYDCYYQVIHESDMDGNVFSVRYGYDLLKSISDSLTEEQVEEILEHSDGSAEEREFEAASKVINNVKDEDMERLEYHLHQQISNPDVRATLRYTEEGSVSGFRIFTLIFPDEDGFARSDFEDAVESVTTTGERGARYLGSSFAVDTGGDRISGALEPI